MSKRGAVHLVREIESVIDRFRKEYDMTYVEVVGVLELISFTMLKEALELAEEES